MIFLLGRIIARLFSIDIQKAQKVAIWVLIGLVGLIVLIVGLWVRSCFNKPAKLDEAEIQKAQEAVKTRNDTELRNILANADVREQVIAGTVANAEANTAAAKQTAKERYANMNTSDLAAELEARK